MTSTYHLSTYDAHIITDEKEIADYYFQLINHTKNYKAAANWMINEVKSFINENGILLQDFNVQPKQLAEIIQLLDDNIISSSGAKSIFKVYTEGNTKSAVALAEELNLIQSSDKDELATWIENVLAKYPEKVAEYKKGKKGNLNLFVGEVMKLSRGAANPKDTTQALVSILNN